MWVFPGTHCLPLLRDQQDLCCSLGTHCPMQASQGPAGPVLSSGNPLPPTGFSGTQDLWCRLGTHCSLLAAAAQGPEGPVLSSREPLPAACPCSGTCSTCDIILDPQLLLRDPQNLCCCLRTHCHMQASHRHSGPVMSSWVPLTPGYCSGTHRFCAVHSGLIALFLPLVRDPQTCAVIYV